MGPAQRRKGVTVQLPLPEVLESPPTRESVVPVWTTLDDEHRAMVVATLARLIAKLVAAHRTPTLTADQGDRPCVRP
jgi:hypothetical protein